ncbi:MAG: translation elongation factor 4 [Caldisericota bacterium]|jgi:GTP-binding protein LepA|nr:translation elongation factor 4 [Caldisericota bacterium]
MNPRNIRNFCVIAHIDHGKSTLADRFLERAGFILKNKGDQVLDQMDLEKERGITIKAHPIRLSYTARDGSPMVFNLIDTPGHVDFNYEVSRSIAACEGAILVVDATQGVEAQTVANVYLALNHNLTILTAINKIDLPNADVVETKREIEEIIGLDTSNAVLVSAKTGVGVDELLRAVEDTIPCPTGSADAPLKCLVFDSHFDTYKGVVVHIRVFEGTIRKGDHIRLMAVDEEFEVGEVGYFELTALVTESLTAGDVGYFAAVIRDPKSVHIGDTVTSALHPVLEPIPGYRPVLPMVFAGIYPVDANDYEGLKSSLGRLQLNDASFTYEPETSGALGFGFRCGFSGLLHLEVLTERLRREYGQEIVVTVPNVRYRIIKRNTMEEVLADSPSKFPPLGEIENIEEPFVKAQIVVPHDSIGDVMELTNKRRGTFINMSYPESRRVVLEYELPLSEIITDFFDRLKSITKGYGTLDYQIAGYRRERLSKVDVLVNGVPVDALSFVAHEDDIQRDGRSLLKRLRQHIPRQNYEVALQAAIGGKIIARENIVQLRKDVLAKCYGGDVSRKRKLLEKQREGKKRMKQIGKVSIPQEAFLSILKRDSDD